MIRVRIQDLACFVSVVEKGGVTSAAESMYMTQSSVSKSIARLEKAMGVPLFDRSRRSLELTADGFAAVTYARDVLAAYDTMMKAVGRRRQTLRLGVLPILDSYGLAGRLSRFAELNPGTVLDVIEMDNRSIGPALAEGALDAALYRPDPTQKNLHAEVLCPDELVLLLPAGHPLLRYEQVPLERCRGEKFIILSRGTQLYEASINACEAAGFTPNIVYTGSSGATFARLVREKAGVALLLDTVAQSLVGDGLHIRRLSRQIRGDFCFVCAEGRQHEMAMQKLRNLLIQRGGVW